MPWQIFILWSCLSQRRERGPGRRQSCFRECKLSSPWSSCPGRGTASPSIMASAEVSLCRARNNPGSALTCPSAESVGLAGCPRFLGPPKSPRPSLADCCSCQPPAQAGAPPGACQASHITGMGRREEPTFRLGPWASGRC